MAYIEIGEATFFTNVPSGYIPSPGESERVANQVVTHFEKKIEERGLADQIAVTRVTYETGCILTTVSLGVSVAALTGGLIAFGKHYPKIRQSIILLLRDIHGFYVHLRDKDKEVTTWLYSDSVFETAKAEEFANAIQSGTEKTVIPSKSPTRRKSTA